MKEHFITSLFLISLILNILVFFINWNNTSKLKIQIETISRELVELDAEVNFATKEAQTVLDIFLNGRFE